MKSYLFRKEVRHIMEVSHFPLYRLPFPTCPPNISNKAFAVDTCMTRSVTLEQLLYSFKERHLTTEIQVQVKYKRNIIMIKIQKGFSRK